MATTSVIDIQRNAFGDIVMMNDKLCYVDYQDKEGYAVFQCEDKGYILKEKTLYLMTEDSYIRLLLRMNIILDTRK